MKRYFILLFALFLMVSLSAQEEVVQVTNINEFRGSFPFWPSPSAWSKSSVPTTSDSVLIQKENACWLYSASAVCTFLLIGDDANVNPYGTLNLYEKLTCGGDILIQKGGLIELSTANVDPLTANSIQISEGGQLQVSQPSTVKADIVCSGEIILQTDLTCTGDILVKDGVIIYLKVSGVTLAASTITIENGAQLYVSKPSTVDADIVCSGEIVPNADLTCTGDILVEDGGSINLDVSGVTLTASTITIEDGGQLSVSKLSTLASDVVCYGTIDISNSGSADLTIGGDLALHPGTGNQAVLRVGAEDNLTVTGTTTCDTYIKNGQWVFYNSPFASGSTANQLYLGGTPDVYLYSWPAGASSDWSNLENITSLSTNLGDYPGYVMWLAGDDPHSFEQSGELRVEVKTSYEYELSDASAFSNTDGWNLLGNPFMADLDVTQLEFDTTKIRNAVFIYDGSTYVEYDGIIGSKVPRYIAPMQSFFMQYNSPPMGSTTSTLGMDGDMTSFSDTTVYLKNESSKDSPFLPNLMTVCLQDATGDTDRMRVWLNAEATFASEPIYDVTKLLGTNANNYIYHEDAEENLYYRYGVPGPVEGEELAVSINLIVNNPGEMTFSFYEIDQFDSEYSIILTDNLTNGYYNLRETSSLTFESDEGTFDDRFVLHFTKGTTGVGESDIVTTKIFCVDHTVNVNFASEPEFAASVSVIDMAGRTCYNATLSQKNNQFILDLPAGVYVVKTVNGSVLSSEKIVLN